MSATTIGTTRVKPFLSDAWLTDAAAAFAELPVDADRAVGVGLTITNAPPGIANGLLLRVDLDSGGLRIDRATPPERGNPHLRLSYRAAAGLLFGSALDRVRIFETGETVVTGNFTQLFFWDRTLQQDPGGVLGRLRRQTSGLPGELGEIGWPEPGGRVTEPEDEATAVDAAAEALPTAIAALRREVGHSTPGAQLYVSVAGRPVADVALGTARPGVPFTRAATPLWYCCAKPLGSLAIGQLWERDLLDPFACVSDYLPDFTGGRRDELTLLHLLTHTGPVPTGMDPLHGYLFGPDEPRRALVRNLRIPADGVWGKQVNYVQWWAWVLLAEVIEKVDGRNYDTYIEEEILRPCGISGTTRVRLTPEDFRRVGATLPVIYISAAGRAHQPTYWFSSEGGTTCELPGVNTRGPMSDLGRFYEVLLAGARAPGGRVAAPTTVAALTARHRNGIHDRFGNADWGLGLRLECRHLDPALTSFSRHSSPRSYGHEGLWTATAFADPDAGLAIALHLNGKTGHEQHRARLMRICDAVYEDLRLA